MVRAAAAIAARTDGFTGHRLYPFRVEDARISCYAAPSMLACAAFFEESRMKFTDVP